MPGYPKRIVNRGRCHEVTGTLKLEGKTFLVLEKPLSPKRCCYRVFDPKAGPRGELRVIHVLRRNKQGRAYVEVMRRASEGNVNLPRIVEYYERGGRIYLVLTWIYGQVLSDYLDAAREDVRLRPSAVESFKLFRGLAHGLRHMHHKKNFVHGDIRPENLVLSREPNRLVLIDFGNAWLAERTLARGAGDGASEFYNAPEQLREQPLVDFRSDQFSATVVFYEMLTLDLPFEGLGGKAGIDHHHANAMQGTLVGPSQKSWDRQHLPGRLWRRIDRVVTRGLSICPEGRYPNARDWLAELDAIHARLLLDAGKPTAAQPFLWVADWFAKHWPFRKGQR